MTQTSNPVLLTPIKFVLHVSLFFAIYYIGWKIGIEIKGPSRGNFL